MFLFLMFLFFWVPLGIGIMLPGRKTLGVYFLLWLIFGIYVMSSNADDAGAAIGQFIFMIAVFGGCGGAIIKATILFAKRQPKLLKPIFVLATLFILSPMFLLSWTAISTHLNERPPTIEQSNQFLDAKMGNGNFKLPIKSHISLSIFNSTRPRHRPLKSYSLERRSALKDLMKTEQPHITPLDVREIRIYLPKKLRKYSNGQRRYLSRTQKWCEIHDPSFATIWCDTMRWGKAYKQPNNFRYRLKPVDETLYKTLRSTSSYLHTTTEKETILSNYSIAHFQDESIYYKNHTDIFPYLHCKDKNVNNRHRCTLFFQTNDEIWVTVEYLAKEHEIEAAARWAFSRGQALIGELSNHQYTPLP